MLKIITKQELKEKFEQNEDFVLIEVLEEQEYKRMHIKGSINIPLKHIAHEAEKRFNKDEELIVYCSNYDCGASPAAAKKLEAVGFKNIKDFEGGKKEWKEAGFPMEGEEA